MTKNTIKSMSTATVEYIAKKLGCTATKAELTKQLATKAEEMEKAYTAFKLIAKAEAEQNRQAKAEEQKQKQEALAKAKAEAEQKQSKQKQSKAKQTKEQKQKNTEAKEQKQKHQAEALEAVIKAFTLKDTDLKHDVKKHKITVFYKLGENKKKAVMEIFVTTKDFHICTKAKHENAEYHESWGFKYDSRQTDIKAIKAIYNTVLGVLKEEQKQKQTDKKQKKGGK